MSVQFEGGGLELKNKYWVYKKMENRFAIDMANMQALYGRWAPNDTIVKAVLYEAVIDVYNTNDTRYVEWILATTGLGILEGEEDDDSVGRWLWGPGVLNQNIPIPGTLGRNNTACSGS